jgi:hypothetical protein
MYYDECLGGTACDPAGRAAHVLRTEPMISRNSSNKKSNPIGAIAQALTPGSNRKDPNSETLGPESLDNASTHTSINAGGETIRSTPSVEVSTKRKINYGNNNNSH